MHSKHNKKLFFLLLFTFSKLLYRIAHFIQKAILLAAFIFSFDSCICLLLMFRNDKLRKINKFQSAESVALQNVSGMGAFFILLVLFWNRTATICTLLLRRRRRQSFPLSFSPSHSSTAVAQLFINMLPRNLEGMGLPFVKNLKFWN